MISKAEIGRAATLLVALIIAGMFLAGCVADTPKTYLDWDGVRETALTASPTSVKARLVHGQQSAGAGDAHASTRRQLCGDADFCLAAHRTGDFRFR
jgi:hypothetical protein